MARRQSHVVYVSDVPSTDYVAAGVRVVPNIIYNLRDLIHLTPVGRRPRSPLMTIDGPQVTILISPFVPYGNPVIVKILDVGVTCQEP